jgi:hypothetical protein
VRLTAAARHAGRRIRPPATDGTQDPGRMMHDTNGRHPGTSVVARPGRASRLLSALLAAAVAALAGCVASSDRGREGVRNELSDTEVEQVRSWSDIAGRHFPTYVEALQKFGSRNPADWDEGERILQLVERLFDRPVEPMLRKALHDESPQVREAARKALARRGELYRLWMELHPKPEELEARTDEARTAARRARYVRWIKTRESMIALGDDAAALLIDSFLQMLPRATPDEQMIIRDELKACGPRVVPVLAAILDLPPREGSLPIRMQCMLVLAGFADLPDAEAALRRCSKGDHAPTRKMVAEALRTAHGQRKSGAPRAILEPMLREDPAWEVRAAAAQALGEIGNPDAVPALLDVLGHCTLTVPEDRTSLLKFIVGALGLLRSRAAVEPLIRVLETEMNIDLRRNTLKALNRITGQYFASAAEWRDWVGRPGNR